jgi:hypothetical protein
MPYLRPIQALILALAAGAAGADTMATTVDGRQVLLRDDGRWEYMQPDTRAERSALLSLENRAELARGCRLGLRLQNDLVAQIRTLVLRFTAFKGDGIPFETVSRGFSFIKPTVSQYQEIDFRGITCDEISAVQVTAARNCHVGDLTKYSASADDCAALVEVIPSDILPFAKPLARD